MNYKTTTITLASTLSVTYLSLVVMYGNALINTNHKSLSAYESVGYTLVDNSQTLPYSAEYQKKVWETKLQRAENMVSILSE